MIQKVSEGFSPVAIRMVRDSARQSSCRRRQVGAAVFDLNGILLGVGWNNEQPFENGVARSCLEGDCPRGMAPYATIPADSPYSDCIAQHAEIMALSKAYGSEDQKDWFAEPDIVLVVTHKPCHECTPVLEQWGILTYYLEEL